VAKVNGPGRSSRTPFKHWVLDSHLGKICGVISTRSRSVPAVPRPFLCVDLCAGDGSETDEHRSSPRIITHHCNWLASRGFDVRSDLIEKHSATFESLEANMQGVDVNHTCVLHNDDAREFRFVPTCANQAVFINCDPNSIADLPFSESLARSLTPTTTMTLTLGCNVGGLKRMTREQRQSWFDYISVMIDIMPSWHDAMLIAIESDASQWAYFTRLPRVWSVSQMHHVKQRGSKMFEHGVTVESLRCDKRAFMELVSRLFLTKAEVRCG
jgi:hypothetical protein